MSSRFSAVHNVHIRSIDLASIFLTGDCVNVQPRSKALAVQRQTASFIGSEGDFNQFPLFSKPIPLALLDEPMHYSVTHTGKCIHVRNLDIVSISSSSIVQIGSNNSIATESRVKHIRQLQRSPEAEVVE